MNTMHTATGDRLTRKAYLLALMARGRDAVETWVARLSDEQRAAAARPDNWGAKHTLAHIAHWNLALLTALELRARGAAVPFQWEDMHGQNARLMASSSERIWTEVADQAGAAYAALRGWAERLSEEELAAPDDFAWQTGGPLWHSFLGNTFFHYLDHLAQFYSASGHAEQAAALRVQIDEVNQAHELH